MTLGGVRQWVRVSGADRQTVPLLCLHGGPGGNHWAFEWLVGPGLQTERTVIYHEQRGCGRSDAPTDAADYSIQRLVADLTELTDILALPEVDLLGYSFGGGLALELARAQPLRVRRVVAQAPAFSMLDPQIVSSQLGGFLQVAEGEILEAIKAVVSGPVPAAQQLEQVWNVVDQQTVDRFLFQDPRFAALNRQLWQESGLVNTGDMAHALNQQPPSDTPHHLDQITAPVLIVAGRHDRNVPLESLESMVATLPDARLNVFEHSAHFPDTEETASFVRTVLSFLDAEES